MNICVFGTASAIVDFSYIKAVEELGELIAKKGNTLIFGGVDNGLMGAVARGASKVQGRQIIGIAPEFYDRTTLYKKCNELILTKTMREKKVEMIKRADAFIMVPGGLGTMELWFDILSLRKNGHMDMPIAIYNIHGYFNDLYELVEKMEKEGFVDKKVLDYFCFYENAEELLADLEDAVQALKADK